MKKCKKCKNDLEDIYFDKISDNKIIGCFKFCYDCREKCRIANNNRKDKRIIQSKIYYEENKEKLNNLNKLWRNKNKDKLREYEKSDSRKQYHSKWIKDKRKEEPHRFIYYSAKSRSKKNNIIFDITIEDILNIYPIDNKCPIFGIELQPNLKNIKDNSPSLDRIVPELGYVKGNIIVISHKANRIKNNASIEDLEKILYFLKGLL